MSSAASADPPAEPGPNLRQLLTFLPDVARMLIGVVRDPRVPAPAKAQAAGLLALGLSPIDALPVVGQLELAGAVLLAVRQLVKHAGQQVLAEHWAGSEQGLATVLMLAEVGLRPRRLLWRLATRRR